MDLDAPCGRYFKYRDLIECGKTWMDLVGRGVPVDNLPREHESVEALRLLCEEVVDPVCDLFGKLELTYGFASPRLTKYIAARIAPQLDQHAACERSRTGKLVCARGGASVDFVVPGVASEEVAFYVATKTPFDRMYIIDDARPIHVSHGPQHTRAIVRLVEGPSGRLVPRRVSVDQLHR